MVAFKGTVLVTDILACGNSICLLVNDKTYEIKKENA